MSAIGTYLPALSGHQPVGGGTQEKRSTAALEAQIRKEKVQLNDWVTCVSAQTPKGKAEIQSLSAQISAAQQQIDRINNEATQSTSSSGTSGSLDVWA